MATYSVNELANLADKIRSHSKTADKASALVINRAATFAVKKSIESITSDVTLKSAYVKSKIKRVSRASPSNLRSTVVASDKATLLTRFTHFKTADGVKVRINQGAGFRSIKGAFIARNLRGSAASGIALRNSTAVGYFERSLGKGKQTSAKAAKLARIKAKAEAKPNGMTVLHSRSINQMFQSTREDVQPELKEFMADGFLTDFKRLLK